MAVLEITDSNFDEKILKSNIPVVVDLWAEWCGPCRMISPIMEDMAVEFEGKALMSKLDVDAFPAIAAKYSIRNIPTVLFFKAGELVDKQVGAVPKAKFIDKLNAIL